MKCPACPRPTRALLVAAAVAALVLVAMTPTLISKCLEPDTSWMAPAPQWRW